MMDLKSIGLSLRILLIMNIFSNLSYIFLSYQPWDFFGRNDAKAETPFFMLRRASLVAQMVKNPSVMQEGWFDRWVRKIP